MRRALRGETHYDLHRQDISMPSMARFNLERTGSEVRDFYAVHQLAKDMPAIRRKLDILNKGTIMLLSAIWEGFCEDLTAEALLLLVDGAPDSAALPTTLQRIVARELKQSPHELAVWRLAGDGWQDVLHTRLSHLQMERNRRLNTPTSTNIDEFFKQALGIDAMSSNWATTQASAKENASRLDTFIELRNAIAHRGPGDDVVPKKVFQNGGLWVGVLNLWGVSPRIGGGGGALKVRDH